MSQDNTADGWLKKKWTIVNGKRCLLKTGNDALQQEPYNEVLASIINLSLLKKSVYIGGTFFLFLSFFFHSAVLGSSISVTSF